MVKPDWPFCWDRYIFFGACCCKWVRMRLFAARVSLIKVDVIDFFCVFDIDTVVVGARGFSLPKFPKFRSISRSKGLS